jgi:hypothetical protein
VRGRLSEGDRSNKERQTYKNTEHPTNLAHQGPTSGKPENTFLTFLTYYKCKKYSFKKVEAT